MSRLPALVIVPLALVLAPAASAASLRGTCQTRLDEHVKRAAAGYFFYAEDPDSGKYACGASTEERGEFDRYPSAVQAAFTQCQNEADERGVKSRCEPLAHGSRGPDAAAGLVRDALRCGQLPGNRWAWTERAFCDLPWTGPAGAAGVVIWNHGLSGTVPAHSSPVAPVLRLLQARGWDVVKISRNNLAETTVEQSLYRWTQRTLEEIAARRKEGYPRVILAGQSFGGYISLETADSTPGVFGVVAMAPGVRVGGAGRLDPSTTERIVGRLAVERLVLVFPRGDALFSNVERGPGAARALAGRRGSYLLLDERHDIAEHGGGTTGKFAVRYGPCVVDYLAGPAPESGAIRCPAATLAEQARVARDLLPRPPGGMGWTAWGILEPAGEVIGFGTVDGADGKRALFGVAAGWRRGGVYPTTPADEGTTFALPGRGAVAVKAGVLTFTPASGGKPQTARLTELAGDP